MAEPVPRTRRLTADDRRRQLVGLGLRMLTEVPIHELSIDRVAARRMLRACAPDPDAAPDEQLTQMLGGYVDFLTRRRGPYVALFRGSAGGADYVREIYEQTREVFTARALSALGLTDPPPLVALAVRGWFCFVEDAALAWAVEQPVDRDTFIQMLVRSLHALVDTAA